MRKTFEDALESWTGVVTRHSGLVITACLLLVGVSATQLPRLELDTSNESYLLENDPAIEAYGHLRAQFGRDEVIVVAFEPAEIFDLDFLRYLEGIHRVVEEEVPHLERVTSLINIRSVIGEGDELIVGDLLEEFPATDAELIALRERVLATPSYVGGVISPDGDITALIIETDAYSRVDFEDDTAGALAGFDDPSLEAPFPDQEPSQRPFLTPAENSATIESVKALIERHRMPHIPVYVSGSSMLAHEVSQGMKREVPIFFGLSLAVIAVALLALFRRMMPCAVVLLSVVLSTIGSFGTAAALGQSLSILSQILPSFILSVGVGYAVHLLAIYFQRLDGGDSPQAALVQAMRHSGPPIMMTALTTSVGLASFLIALMPPMRQFGLAAMLGVGWTLLFTLSLLPALISRLPMQARSGLGDAGITNVVLQRIGIGAARHPWKVVFSATLLAVACVISTFQLKASNNPIYYLAPENAFRVSFLYLDEHMKTSTSLELFIDAGEENALYEPEVMNRLDALGQYFMNFEHEGYRFTRTTSVVDIAKETHQALNANDPASYQIAQERAMLAQELFLFENSGSEDLERVVDPQFQKARYSALAQFRDGNLVARIIHEMQRDLPAILGPEITWSITGSSSLIARTVEATTTSLFRTYALALAVITPLMMLLIGSLRAGLVSMAPNLLPILLTLAIMPLLEVPLDLFTMMLGCIAIGLAVDDTLHFIHGFRSRYAETGDPYQAIEQTLNTTGRALLFTSIVLCSGFLVLTLSSMSNLQALGALTAFAIGAAFILDIIVTPALLILVYPKRDT
jgi:hypothetical protein